MQRKAPAGCQWGSEGTCPTDDNRRAVLVSRASLISDPRVCVIRMTPPELHGVNENAGSLGAKAVNRSQGDSGGSRSP